MKGNEKKPVGRGKLEAWSLVAVAFAARIFSYLSLTNNVVLNMKVHYFFNVILKKIFLRSLIRKVSWWSCKINSRSVR